MTPTPQESFAIAAGYNVAAMSLTNIESIKPTSDEYFVGPKALPLFSSGEKIYRLDRFIHTSGFQSVIWRFTRLTYAQYTYLKTTYCNGTLSGKVTINTTLGGTTYSRMNAVMQLKDPVDYRAEFRYQDADVLFSITGAAS